MLQNPTAPAWRAPEGPHGLAAVPVGAGEIGRLGGGAWPDSEPTRRAKLTARMAEARGADTTAS